MAEVRSLHGVTTAEIFSDGLENLDKIESVALALKWKDGTVTAGSSTADPATLALLVLALDNYQRHLLSLMSGDEE
ncbi:MAG: hypothetical protein HON65_06795 [Rhodospirillales bacterium]|jgi:hypothetical protein|nr:hypothetical protein [Rhodospirillales bacterium]